MNLGEIIGDVIEAVIGKEGDGRRQDEVRPASEDPYGDPADQEVRPASEDPYGDPGAGPSAGAVGYDPAEVRPASEDPYGDPADQEVRPASEDPYGDPADQEQAPPPTPQRNWPF